MRFWVCCFSFSGFCQYYRYFGGELPAHRPTFQKVSPQSHLVIIFALWQGPSWCWRKQCSSPRMVCYDSSYTPRLRSNLQDWCSCWPFFYCGQPLFRTLVLRGPILGPVASLSLMFLKRSGLSSPHQCLNKPINEWLRLWLVFNPLHVCYCN